MFKTMYFCATKIYVLVIVWVQRLLLIIDVYLPQKSRLYYRFGTGTCNTSIEQCVYKTSKRLDEAYMYKAIQLGK
ncbi:hypothetical protein KSC_053350 [Ktedonobacter sp. SOSP1-52]|nr:hypothetical protein KSC_053350 [Ktedonobacter sp. SOSP1-52]